MPSPRRWVLPLVAVVLAAGAGRLGAQSLASAPAGIARLSARTEEMAAAGKEQSPLGRRLAVAERRRLAPVASLILPGTGQALLHQDRFVAYLALEAWAVLEFANQRTEARRQQTRFRNLARDVARSLYGPARPVGDWAYYESMEHYVESGVFDRLPGGDVDPELDAETYNGAMWQLARQTFWPDPTIPPLPSSSEYRNAINFYMVRAVRAEFRWSWRNAQLEQDIYVRTIRRSNTSFREARRALGLVIANHLLSSVDAFVSLRVEGLEGGDGRGFALVGRLPMP
ncbi:MAG: hypothetical protein ACYC3L_11835 [Gemmatimonadaceae bacterium]